MTVQSLPELAAHLKEAKNVLIMAGALCDEVSFNGKGLTDYVVDIAAKTSAPVAATGTSIVGLKQRNVERLKKMWLADVPNYMRHLWQDSISENKPELLIFIGYNPALARKFISTIKDAETMFLGNVYIGEATYSLPDAPSLKDWQKNLDQVIQAL